MTLLLFLIAFTAFLPIILHQLPVFTGLPGAFVTGLNTLMVYVWSFNLILPIPTILTVTTLAVGYHFKVYLYHLIARIIGWVRGGTS